jgi:hypothetical protein
VALWSSRTPWSPASWHDGRSCWGTARADPGPHGIAAIGCATPRDGSRARGRHHRLAGQHLVRDRTHSHHRCAVRGQLQCRRYASCPTPRPLRIGAGRWWRRDARGHSVFLCGDWPIGDTRSGGGGGKKENRARECGRGARFPGSDSWPPPRARAPRNWRAGEAGKAGKAGKAESGDALVPLYLAGAIAARGPCCSEPY